MLPSLKTAFTLLSLLQLLSSTAEAGTLTSQQLLKEQLLKEKLLKEVTRWIQNLTSGVQVPCNDTRVAQVAFTDQKPSEEKLLCQADKALSKVTRCKKNYEPLIRNLKRLHGHTKCNLSDENEIYLRHFLPALGNFTQAMFRRGLRPAAQ